MPNPTEQKKFLDWLLSRGAALRDVTSEYELARFVTANGVGVVYRSGKTNNSHAAEAYAAFRDGTPWIAATVAKRVRKPQVEAKLLERDGAECFFCGRPTTDGDRTVEHLVSITDGGTNHLKNLALAHKACNAAVANWSVVEKVKYRDGARGVSCRKS